MHELQFTKLFFSDIEVDVGSWFNFEIKLGHLESYFIFLFYSSISLVFYCFTLYWCVIIVVNSNFFHFCVCAVCKHISIWLLTGVVRTKVLRSAASTLCAYIHGEFIACRCITWERLCKRRRKEESCPRHLSACSFLDEAMALCGLVGRRCTCTIRSPRTPILSILWPVVGTSLAPSPQHTQSPTPIKNKRTKNNAWELNSRRSRAKGHKMLFEKRSNWAFGLFANLWLEKTICEP